MYRALAHAWLVTLLCLCATNVAQADDEQSQRAMFERARVQLRNEQWDKAREILDAIWRERKTYDVALQLGQAEYHLKRFREAAEHLAYGLATLPPREKLQTAERSRQILGLCRKEVGALDLRIKNKGADISIDGTVIGVSPLMTELFLEPGGHRFEVRLAAHRPETWSMQLAAGQTQVRLVELVLLSPPTADDEHPSSKRTSPRGSASLTPQATDVLAHRTSYVPMVPGGIVAVAAISAGIGFYLLRKSRESEANDIQGRVGPNGCWTPSTATTQSECARLVTLSADYDSFGRLELLSLLIGGAALLGTGTYFLVARPDQVRPHTTGWRTPLSIGASLTRRQTGLDIGLDF